MPLSTIDSASLSTPITAVDLAYTGTLTGGTGVVNLGSGQVYKDASGNVGIGTSSPAVHTHISGTGSQQLRLQTTSINGQTVSLQVYAPNSDASANAYQIGSGITADNEWVVQDITSAQVVDKYIRGASGFRAFYTNGAERARITSGGDFLIGATSFTGYDTAFRFSTGGQQLGRSTNGDQIAFFTAGSLSGKISTSGTTTTYATSSDYRLKEAVTPMTGALLKVAALKPVTYKWKVDGSDGQGFIAHELAEVEAGCVVGEKDAVDAEGNPQYQGIDTSFLIATLSAAIQELHALVKTQDNTITALTARITALETA